MGNRGGKTFTTVTFGVYDRKGRRPTMEDAHITEADLFGVRENFYFAVFDGHGGDAVSKFASVHMLKQLKRSRSMRSRGTDPLALAKSMKKAHINLDASLRKEKPKGYCIADFCGCTAVSCLVTPSNYVVANLGDSRIILCRDGKPIALSTDHKPYDDEEKARIEKAGGKVFWGRVNGKLAVSRALGDFVHKGEENVKPEGQMVTCLPEMKVFERKDEDQFIVLACDGIWDVLSNEDVCNLVLAQLDKDNKDCNALAKMVVDAAYDKGSSDNLSAIVALITTPPSETTNEGRKKKSTSRKAGPSPKKEEKKTAMKAL